MLTNQQLVNQDTKILMDQPNFIQFKLWDPNFVVIEFSILATNFKALNIPHLSFIPKFVDSINQFLIISLQLSLSY